MPGFSKKTGKANGTIRQRQVPQRTVKSTGSQPLCSKVATQLGSLSGRVGREEDLTDCPSECGGSLGSLETAPLGEKRLLPVLLP